MSEQTSFLPAGPLPFISPDFHVLGMVGRVGDGFVYTARDGLRQARLREYCPPGLTIRGASGAVLPRQALFGDAFQDGIERFVEQGQRLAALSHPGVAAIWDAMAASSASGVLLGGYLVGEPVGESLAATLATGRQLTPGEVATFAAELADALAAVHAHGLTHLALSTQTVTIAAGRVQLTDFTVDNRPYMPLLGTQEGLIRPGYSPLEHYEGPGGAPLGPPADVYAACALIYRLITGAAPAPATQRFRDRSISELAGRDSYSPRLLEAVRTGLALEARDRFPDGAALRAALDEPAAAAVPGVAAQPVISIAKHVPPPPPAPSLEPAPPPRPSRLPLVLGILFMLVLVVGALLALQQGWFEPDEEPVANKVAPPRPEPRPPTKTTPAIPTLAVGESREGRLQAGDDRSPSGQYQDRFTLTGRRGERIELRLSSNDFDPRLMIRGNGLNQFNDDDLENQSLNSRMIVTLPADGAYTIIVSSYEQDRTGAYRLEAAAAPPDVQAANGATRLSGAWRLEEDADCVDPATITVSGATLTLTRGGVVSREQIVADDGRRVRTRMVGGPSDGELFLFDIAADGSSFETDEGVWVRCAGR
jgi:serine/threonine protein kinase